MYGEARNVFSMKEGEIVLPPEVTEVAGAIDQPQCAIAPLAYVAGVQPAVVANHRARCLVIVPIAFENIRTVDEDFARGR
jgi:hypothetical protein